MNYTGDRAAPIDPAAVDPYASTEHPQGPPYAASTDSRAIHEDVARTRGEMDRTIDELSDRLRPRNLFDDLLGAIGLGSGDDEYEARHDNRGTGDYLKDVGKQAGGKILGGLGRTVRNHPFSATALTAGLAWLLFDSGDKSEQRRRAPGNWRDLPEHSGSFVDARTGRPYTQDYGRAYRGQAPQGSQQQGYAGAAWDSTKDAAGTAAEATGSAASTVAGAIGSAASAIGGAVSSAAGTTKDALTGAAGTTADASRRGYEGTVQYGQRGYEGATYYGREGYRQSRQGFQRSLQDYPLAIGLAALAAGALAGLAVPRTRTEDEYFGRQSDEVKGTAAAVGREAWQRGQMTASTAASTAQQQARDEGLDPNTLAGKARAVAGAVADDVRDIAQKVKQDVTEGVEQIKDDVAAKADEEGLTPEQLKEKARNVAEATKADAQAEAEHHAEETKKVAADSHA